MNRYPQGDPVNEARLLIPWYITGKLSDADKTLVEEMLEQHPELKEDYLREMKTVELLRDNDSLLQLTAVDSTQQRLDKLMKRIQREEMAETARQPDFRTGSNAKKQRPAAGGAFFANYYHPWNG